MQKEKANTTIEKENLYKNREGLIYARVSSKRQELEGTGLTSQEGRCASDLSLISVPHIKTFPDTYTGGGDFMKRPAMRALLDYIDEHPHKKYVVVFDDLKRFARDVEFHFKLKHAFKIRDVLLRCLNYNFDESPEGEFVELIMAGQAQLDRKQNRRQVIQKMSARIEAGYYSFSKKRGYDLIRDKIHGLRAHPNKMGLKILKPALEAFANCELATTTDFCKYLIEGGFWPGKHPNKCLTQAKEILKDYFFMGDIGYEKWGVPRRQGHHQALISAATYEKIQSRLKKKNSIVRIRKDITDEFPVRGLVNCICGKHLTASWSKGRSSKYGYYFCMNRSCSLYRKSIPQALIETGFIKLLKKTKIRNDVGKVINVIFDRVWKEEAITLERKETKLIQTLRELNQKISDLTDLARKAKNDHLRSVYEKEIEQTATELEYERSKSTEGADMLVPYRTALEKAKGLLKSPYAVWKKMEIEEQHDLFFFIFDEKLRYDAKEGYRTTDIPSVARLFEEFVTTNSIYVDLVSNRWNDILRELSEWNQLKIAHEAQLATQ